jgi:hypothetical protein
MRIIVSEKKFYSDGMAIPTFFSAAQNCIAVLRSIGHSHCPLKGPVIEGFYAFQYQILAFNFVAFDAPKLRNLETPKFRCVLVRFGAFWCI